MTFHTALLHKTITLYMLHQETTSLAHFTHRNTISLTTYCTFLTLTLHNLLQFEVFGTAIYRLLRSQLHLQMNIRLHFLTVFSFLVALLLSVEISRLPLLLWLFSHLLLSLLSLTPPQILKQLIHKLSMKPVVGISSTLLLFILCFLTISRGTLCRIFILLTTILPCFLCFLFYSFPILQFGS